MLIDVAFTPGEVQDMASKVCIVVDVIRATSTLTVVMSRNPARVILTATVQKARKFAEQQSIHPLLGGEREGVAPEGFDFGNSPREYQNKDLHGKTLVFSSTNGTRAVADVGLAPHVLLGSFLNATAVTTMALEKARADDLGIMIVCAGREEKFAIDDAWCAGFLISKLTGLIPAEQAFTLGEGGQAALAIFGYYRDPHLLFTGSGAGKAIIAKGLGEDIDFLLQNDLFSTVPTLIQRDRTPPANGFSLLI
jgi:2-phosphosulfolactate phosphatase